MKKILILSIEDDISTTNVMRWINYLDSSVEVIRLHFIDLYNGEIDLRGVTSPLFLHIKGEFFSTDDINIIWTRKWHPFISIEDSNDLIISDNLSCLNSNIKDELNALFNFFIYKIEQNCKTYWLNKPYFNNPNKLKQLYIAEKLGLKTPYSILTTQLIPKDILLNLITKPISDCISIYEKTEIYSSYTSRLKEDESKNNFLVSLFQEEIQKEIELRVFYIDKQCYTLAILSQSNTQTEVDYRNYDNLNPNREEYYQLPDEIRQKIILFMKQLNLQTGSLDFILNKNGEYIFLEVNPCGQYDIFNLCNVKPDKLIAEHLIKKYYEYQY